METLRLVSWNEAERRDRAAALRSLGYRVDAAELPVPFRRGFAPGLAAVVVDLSRLPSHGRDVGVALRMGKATRSVPIVFAGGAEEKIARVRDLLPDAVFASWERIGPALQRAIAKPPRDPVVPAHGLAGYSGTPLPRKLGLREGSVVSLVGAPSGFEQLLGDGVVARRGNRGRRDLTMVFVRKPGDVERTWDRLAGDANVDDVWIVWAKKTSDQYAGVTQTTVRDPGLARGFVDFKVCAIDETWSALRFKRRR